MRPARFQLALFTSLAAVTLLGCQGVTGSGQYTQVRFIDASPDIPAVDLYQNGTPLVYGVSFGTASSYIPVPAGSYTYSADTAGLRQQLATTSGALAPGGQYTVVVSDNAAALRMLLLKDQPAPAPAAQTAVRFLNQATRTGAVDIYLVPEGGSLSRTSPIATGVLLGGTPAYVAGPTGVFSVVALPAGASPDTPDSALYASNQISFVAGSSRTFVLLDQFIGGRPALQMMTTEDSDPSAS